MYIYFTENHFTCAGNRRLSYVAKGPKFSIPEFARDFESRRCRDPSATANSDSSISQHPRSAKRRYGAHSVTRQLGRFRCIVPSVDASLPLCLDHGPPSSGTASLRHPWIHVHSTIARPLTRARRRRQRTQGSWANGDAAVQVGGDTSTSTHHFACLYLYVGALLISRGRGVLLQGSRARRKGMAQLT